MRHALPEGARRTRGRHALIVCCGNADRGDDGVGPACADALRLLGLAARCLPGDAFTLLDAWEGHQRVIIVDAIVTGAAAPGTIHRFEIHNGAGAEQFQARLGSSTHGFGIAEAFRLGQITKNVPEEAIDYGIEAAGFEWGAGLSGEVHAAVQRLATALARESAEGPGVGAPDKLASGQ